jgi:hypothetical protein
MGEINPNLLRALPDKIERLEAMRKRRAVALDKEYTRRSGIGNYLAKEIEALDLCIGMLHRVIERRKAIEQSPDAPEGRKTPPAAEEVIAEMERQS